MKALPPDLGILYRQRLKEASSSNHDDTAAVTGDKSQQVKHLMTFRRIQAEAREEGTFDQASSSASQRHHPRESRPLELNPSSAAPLSTEVRPPYTRPCLLGNLSDHTVLECSTSLTSEEKRRKLQPHRRCFHCAKRNHVASEGRRARNLKYAHCAGQQLTSLCNVCTPTQNQAKRLGNASAPSVQRASGSESINTPPPATSVSTSCTGLMPVFLQTGRASAVALARSILLRFLLDTGSQRTIVRQHSTNKTTIDALEVLEISVVTSPPADSVIVTMMTHQGLVPADARSEATTVLEDEISILIGSDLYWEVVTGQITRLLPQVTAAETLFGWTIPGTLHDLPKGSAVHTTSLFLAVGEPAANDASLDMDISSRWRLDTLGVQDDPDSKHGTHMALEEFERHVSKKGGRYEVPLLIREPGLDAGHNNFALARQRLFMQLRRFKQ
ncbi:uncharacterized protein LOC119455640 [Dermacentor silvarum]|uniref:uncharacterized protein LOC119455640 n=1 Tax=Dermacentor silvarum TaxID=543639 RepID=UPI00189A67A8|nr:uncharacterized protein LOC119455640 [Dermacentor silvarum]